MYNLIVKGIGWAQNRDTIMGSRLFEYTETRLAVGLGKSLIWLA